MSQVTDIRAALKAVLKDLPGEVQVAMGPSEYATGNEFNTFNFYIQVKVGEQSEEHVELLDEMLEREGELSIKQVVEAADIPHVSDITITKASGHQLYPNPEDEEKLDQLGAQWTARTFL